MPDSTATAWHPLSTAQRSRWFLHQLEGRSSGLHNNAVSARILASVDVAALQRSLQRLADRHPMLRAYFREGTGGPEQAIADHVSVPLGVTDAADLDEQTLLHRIEADSAQGFVPEQAPLIRAHLYRRSDTESVFMLVFSHLVGDGWSYWLMMEELHQMLTGGPLPPPATRGYLEYTAWEADWLRSEAAERQYRYWQHQLRQPLPMLALRADRPRPARPSGRRGLLRFQLDAATAGAVAAISKQTGGTAFTTLLTAYQILLHRLTGQAEIIVGTPLPGRLHADWDRVVGDFVNLIPINTRCDGNPTIDELLQRVRRTAFRALRHQQYPFSLLVERLQLPPRLEDNPLCQTLFVFQKARHLTTDLLALWGDGDSAASAHWGGMKLASFPVYQTALHSGIGLVLEVLDEGTTFACAFKFDADLYDAATLEHYASCFQVLVANLATGTGQRIGTLPLLTPALRHRLIDGFNDTWRPFAEEQLIHQRFEAQAAAHPESPALLHEGRTTKYRELNRRANQIAHYLRMLGVQPDDRVAICLERGPALIAGLLGILKAGGAYVPLDPATPFERLSRILDDCAPVALLTEAAQLDRLPASPLPLLTLDGEPDATMLEHLPDDNPEPAPGQHARHLAYVMYTSGSTGTPKGVMVEHRSVLRLVVNADYARITADDRVAHCANPAFDASTWEVWAPLLNGAATLIMPPATVLDPPTLNRALLEGGATAMWLTVGLFNQYVDLLQEAFSRLRYLLVGGDALDPATVARLLSQRQRPRQIINGYGPTEATTFSATYAIPAAIDPTRPIPIGKPITNTRIYILDNQLQPVPPGVTGEIHIGGPGVARGYLNRPDLTAERFIPDPYSADPGARLYKTGDLGCWRDDGIIEFLGRNDSQIKIRGYRIEPGEIEARLAACAAVQSAAVIAREDTLGDKRLVAYVVPRPGETLSAAELRRQLAASLNAYLVPSAFVTLPALPLTPNGKLDRAALPPPDETALAAQAFEAPETSNETLLAGLWQELLGLRQVGRQDDFFELGGNSLHAVQLITRLRERHRIEIDLRELFSQPTLAGFAAALPHCQETALPPLPTADRSRPLPLSWAQQRLWFLARLDPTASIAYHIPAALRLTGRLDRPALRAALNRIVARHESLRTSFPSVNGAPVQRIAPPDSGFLLAEHELSGLDIDGRRQELHRLCQEEAHQPFDLQRGPLIRGRLLRLAEDEHVLLLTQHHIVSDAWSIDVLARELSALYAAFRSGQPDPLPPLAVQYADYAVWQRQWLTNEVLAQQLEFWRSHLEGAPQLLELPADRARPPVQRYAGSSVPLRIPQPLTSALKALAQHHGTTLFTVLLSGWAALLARLSGEPDVVIGVPVANRRRSEVENLIGFFINTLAIRLHPQGALPAAALLAQAKDAANAAYAHQDVPFEQVVDALQPSRSLSHSPLFQTILTLDNTPADARLDLPGLTLAPVATSDSLRQFDFGAATGHAGSLAFAGAQDTAQFDLSVVLADTADGLAGGLRYATDLFDATTVERFARWYLAVLTGMATDPRQAIGRIPLLSPGEYRQVTEEFQGPRLRRNTPELIHQLFEARAAAQPAAPALVCAGRTICYGELNRRANRVAHQLLAIGLHTGDRVALCLDRGPALIIGLLGTLKAGGAYVPLDPAYPPERLRYLLDDSAPALLMTEPGYAGPLPAHQLPTLPLDAAAPLPEPAGPDDADPDPPRLALGGDSSAYVIYTSGSTGLPKGVVNRHRGLCNLTLASIEAFGITAQSRLLQFASLNFDASIWEIMMALCSGASLHLAPREALLPAAPLLKTLQSGGISHAFLPPSVLARCPDPAQLPPITLLVGGEVCPAALAEAWAPRHRLFNAYGPTESAVCATVYRCPPDHRGPVPIGRPLPNVRIYILDDALQPLPVGVAGEICIAGDGLASGYLHRPDLTAERFVSLPTDPGIRLYRTGDLGRWRADGNLEYLGRNDCQVKVRGFRIELGEIEHALASHPDVAAAAAGVATDSAGQQNLVAWVVPRTGEAVVVDTLRRYLAERLPRHLLPAVYMPLPALPLTPNGKLDREVLPLPTMIADVNTALEHRDPTETAAARDRAAAEAGIATATANIQLERQIAALWQELLPGAEVGRLDNFFELGGHSLLLVQLVQQLSATFGREVAIAELFHYPSVAEQAQYIATLLAAPHETASRPGSTDMATPEVAPAWPSHRAPQGASAA